MINRKMHTYDYFTLGELDKYGQEKLSEEPKGKVKMAIFTTGQSIQDNILYANAQYMGLTYSKEINDSFVIDYNGVKLKVLYINAEMPLKSIFMAKVG